MSGKIKIDGDDMDKIIRKFLAEYQAKNKKRFDLTELQNYLIKHYKGNQVYLEKGGYAQLYHQMQTLKDNCYIKEINSSPYNGLNPPLKMKWQIISKPEVLRWSESKMLQFSDRLNFSYYKNNPSYQTELEWEYIENIYSFLKFRDKREWASLEERSLELFYDEKFLTERKGTAKGRYGILNRLKLSYDDLKMKKYGEMFVYWKHGVGEVGNIIILENHSTFFSYKKKAERNETILDFSPDLLIYGEGKKIENSLTFLEEMADLAKVTILYFGDFDSEGLGIYYRLKERYPDVNIRLQHEAYKLLVSLCHRDYPLGEQKKDTRYFNYFLEELQEYLTEFEFKKLHDIWNRDMRIPQELISFETLLKVKE
jgi:hypothetical protein